MDEKTLDARLLRDFSQFKNKSLKNAMVELLPRSLISEVISASGVNSEINDNYYSLAGNENILKDYIDSKSNEKVNIKVLTNYKPNYDEKKDIKEEIDSISPIFKFLKYEIVFGDDIEDDITQATSDKQCVEVGELKMTEPNNYLTYGEEQSIITNISALSLKENYRKYGKAGLFALNLRFYVSNAKVDDGLENSIKNKGENFWYYNNGIIIICDDFKINDDIIEMENYSIINGGQTTRMIGEIPFSKDFAISCKIIRNKYKDDRVANSKFVSEVAEASNTQKPINSTDIIANKPEQRLLKETMANANVFVQIKRGDRAAANLKENYPEPWQKTKNDELGQLLYAGIYQKPGTARNSKDKIFSDKRKYDMVFGNYSSNKYSVDLIKDILFVRSYYKKWSTEISKDDSAGDVKKGLVKNGFYFFLSTIMLMAKLSYSNDLINEIKNVGLNSEKGQYILCQRTFNNRLFNDDFPSLKNRMYELFNMVYDRYIYKGYEKIKSVKPETVYSNFTKTDKNYYTWIVLDVFDDFAYETPGRVLGIMNQMFYKQNKVEAKLSEELLEQALYNFDNNEEETDNIANDDLSETLRKELKDYRTKEYKARNIKAYDIFTNKELENLVALKPRSVAELKEFGCFKSHPRTKAKHFGEAIVKIVCGVYGDPQDR